MTLNRRSETLLEYIELVDTPQEILNQPTIQRMEWQFNEFLKDVSIKFNVFDESLLNEELKTKFLKLFLLKHYNEQVGGSCVPEFRFKLAFERIYLSNIDRYNARLRLNLVTLNSIEDEILKNVDLTSIYNEKANLDEGVKTDTIDKNTVDSTRTIDENKKRDIVDEKNQETDNTSRNFNRLISEDTPDGQLNLTSNDGSGIIKTANQIDETLDTTNDNGTKTNNDTRNDTSINTTTDKDNLQQDKTGNRTTDKNQSTDKDSERKTSGYQNLGSKAKLLEEYENLYQNVLLEFINCFDKLFLKCY